MNEMPSARGVALAGDVYQHLHVLKACLEALHETTQDRPNPTVAVGMEQNGLGNLDDLVKYRERPPHSYMQVKYAVDSTKLVNLDYLSEKNLLRRLVETHKTLTADGDEAEVRLVTNRAHDPAALLIRDRDGRDNRLAPRALEGGPRSDRGKARAEWARISATDESSIQRFLEDFRLDTAVELTALRNNIELLMTVLGMRSDESAVALATNWVMEKVIEGVRRLTVEAIRTGLGDLGLVAGKQWATVSIATIKRDDLASQATVAIDWVDKIEGDVEWQRVSPKPPATWADLQREIEQIPQHLHGHQRVLVTGHMRQATGFLTGCELRSVVSKKDIATRQKGELWTTEHPIEQTDLVVEEHSLGTDPDVAVVLNVSANATKAVTSWATSTELQIGRIVSLSPSTGVGPTAVTSPGAAHGLAVAVRNEIRDLPRSGDIHLFLVGPLGLAVLLGHYWNRIGRTYVYEHLGGPQYVRAFEVNA